MEPNVFHIRLSTSDEDHESHASDSRESLKQTEATGDHIDVDLHRQHNGTRGDFGGSVEMVDKEREIRNNPEKHVETPTSSIGFKYGPEVYEHYYQEVAPNSSVVDVGEYSSTQSIQQPLTTPPAESPYPMVYVSPAGLLSVLLRYDMAVEMTTDRTLRVVNNRHTAAAAVNARGNSASIFHCGAKIFQTGTTTEAHLFWERRARMQTNGFFFASGATCYQHAFTGGSPDVQLVQPPFQDLSKDMTVTLLYESNNYGPHCIADYNEVASQAKFISLPTGGYVVYVNGTCIQQCEAGDVTVVSGPKMIHMSPVTGIVRLETHFVRVAVDDWYVQIQRCGHRLLASTEEFTLSNGEVECGFDQAQQVKFRSLGMPVDISSLSLQDQDPAILTCIPQETPRSCRSGSNQSACGSRAYSHRVGRRGKGGSRRQAGGATQRANELKHSRSTDVSA